MQEAEALNVSLIALNKEVSGSFGVAGVKAAMDLCGFCGGDPRKPLLPLSAEQLRDAEGVPRQECIRPVAPRECSRPMRRAHPSLVCRGKG